MLMPAAVAEQARNARVGRHVHDRGITMHSLFYIIGVVVVALLVINLIS